MPTGNSVQVDDIVTAGYRAEVSWGGNRDSDGSGYVQFATTNDHSPFTYWDLGGNPDNPEGLFAGWHVTLDRDGCNRLIRAVRQARDAAFGTALQDYVLGSRGPGDDR